jgi:MFS family permease
VLIPSSGRSKVFQATLLIFVLLQLACALAPKIASLLVFRFLAGFFGSPTVTNSGGSLIDVWAPSDRSVTFALFSAASFLGPVIVPVVGGFLTAASWRWNFWMVLIASGIIYGKMLLFLPETYAHCSCKKKQLLMAEKNVKYDIWSAMRSAPWRVSLTGPWIMLFTEPILFSLSLYRALIFGVLSLDFSAYPIVFTDTRHWPANISGLSFLGIVLDTKVDPLYPVPKWVIWQTWYLLSMETSLSHEVPYESKDKGALA